MTMGTKLDLKGMVFSRLVVVGEDTSRGSDHRIKWICKCECGKIVSVTVSSLRRGNTKSCGCLKSEMTVKRNTTHNLAHEPTYQVYLDMRRRCYDKNYVQYKNYGGRGITICDRWLDSFENFHWDMITSYRKGYK